MKNCFKPFARIFILFLFALFLIQINTAFAQNQNAYPLTGVLWPTKKISVCWDNPEPWNLKYRVLVQKAITGTWQKYSSLEFTDWCPATQKDADIHIFINDVGPHTKGLGTSIRRRPGGMVLNFTFNNWCANCKFDLEENIKSIAVHEFGHALGFAHEQNRQDCRFINCLEEPQGSNGSWYITPCDLFSVMNYCNPSYNNNGNLSNSDIYALQKLYGYPLNNINGNISSRNIELVHSTQYLRQTGRGRKRTDWYNLKIYLSGNQADINKIEHVEYQLHETFDDPIVESYEKESKFGLSITVWGQFDLFATVYYIDGTTERIKHYLSFD